ncbi:putative periplasmic lipoprotein [Haloplanus aerogenes]|uniref:Transcriptional initiation protein Tat n=1 Tax=Haloplanus aerogenes TaxID=660522 RepID=A0A3M0DYG9_9EURY|nr:transcriptional initiation protein Tat [Haloplanus aerogenes]AZH25383.1 transcriptional initiation protein Tat [Haloplanus aerogenes]RMB25086.1 hypothetical protein ATH50_0169 [Haloplanus aerogenes]
MHRRRVLAIAVTLLSGCSNLPRATGPRTPPTPSEPTAAPQRSLRVTSLDVEEADDGHLRVLATVQNPTNAQRTRTLRIRVRAGETRTEQQQQVTVAANTEQEVAFDFADVAYDDFSGNGSLNTNWVS